MKLPLPQALHRSLLASALFAALAPPAAALDFAFSAGFYNPGVTAPQPLLLGDALQINAGGNKFFSGVGFTNLSGTVNWNTTDSLFLQSGALISNAGLWDARSDNALVNNGGATSTFNNSGIFRKSVGVGSTSIGSIAFVNSGTIDAQTGVIDFGGGNVTFNAGTQFTGAGLTRITSNASFNGAFTSANLRLQGGTFTGGAAQIGGTVAFSGGALTGDWTVAGGQTLLGVGGGNKFLSGAALTQQGSLLWQTTDSLFLQSGSGLDNQSLVEFQASASLVNNGGATSSFTNSGTLRALAGQVGTVGSIAFVSNGGTMDALGTLNFAGNNATFNTGSQFTGAGVNRITGNASFNGAISSSNLRLENGTYTGGGAVISGSVAFLGGAITGGWELGTGQTLLGQDGNNKFLSSAALVNKGQWLWQSGNSLFLQSGSVLDNQGSFVISTGMSLVNNGGATSSFINSGTLSVASGQAGSVGTIAFVNNGGTLDVAGTLAFNGNNARFNSGSQFVGSGVTVLNSNAIFVDDFQSQNLRLVNGTFSGGDGSTGSKALVGGMVEFTGGFLTGGWELASGQTIAGKAGGNKFLSTANLVNKGLLAWQTTDSLYMQSAALLDNRGLFDAQASVALVNNGGSTSVFNNSGTLQVAAGQTVNVGTIAFVNDGGQLTVASGGLLNFAGNNATFNTGTQMSGAGVVAVTGNASFAGEIAGSNLSLRSGSFTGAAARLSGAAEFGGGFLVGVWEIAPGATLTGASGGNKFLSTVTLTNKGTLAWATGDTLFLQSNGQLINEGLLDVQTDMSLVNNGGATSSIVNRGRLVKSGGAGAMTIGGGLAFSNPGVIEVQAGTIQLPTNFSNPGTMMGTGAFATNELTNTGHLAPGSSAGTLTLNGNYTQTGAGSFDVELASSLAFDRFMINGTASLDGTLALHCIAACALSNGDEFVILDAAGHLTGTFASVSVDGFGAGFQYDVFYDYNQDLVKLTVLQVGAVPEVPIWAMLLGGVGLLALRRRKPT
ncbi:beta strand repeat-containing protein [Roseateles toxinivorans]|uniref:Putative secreted protein with PEP-CTERM sorting signal n=1 Tax=Roseateles toxinivorans TaxID=270368 RepID=A0A4R6QSY6_9BURK|nr:hypothetical protein [Roseateles toxinivorans]TDP73268.1 putative secreted protein with PEP-CTERM sorting signal [Roseateles toxinivorans]